MTFSATFVVEISTMVIIKVLRYFECLSDITIINFYNNANKKIQPGVFCVLGYTALVIGAWWAQHQEVLEIY